MMRSVRTFWVLLWLVILSGSTNQVYAQSVLFNEIALLEPTMRDEDGESGFGWIEVVNPSGAEVSLKDITIQLNDTLEWQFPELPLYKGAYQMIWLSGKNRKEERSKLHASFDVSNSPGNQFRLIDPAGDIIDEVRVRSDTDWYESYARFENGNRNEWLHVTTRTPGYANEKFGLWKRISARSPFRPRDAAVNSCVYYRDRFWIFAGWTGDSFNPSTRIWASVDMLDWELITEGTPYASGASFIVFKDRVWAFDGNAYSTTDGVFWTHEASNLPFGEQTRVIEFEDKLVLLDGTAVYQSNDGKNWSVLCADGPWSDRLLPGFQSLQGKLWIFGGAKSHPASNEPVNDIWCSRDGVNWDRVVNHAPWPGRAWFGETVFDDKIWLFGGWDYWTGEDLNDVWYSENGLTWHELKSSYMWKGRHAPYHWVVDDALWISSGFNTMRYGLFNDVWRLDRVEPGNVDRFYLRDMADPTNILSWSSTLDGYGFPPEGFNFDNVHFFIPSLSDTLNLSKDWQVKGKHSQVILGGTGLVTIKIHDSVSFDADIHLDSLSHLWIENNTSPNIIRANSESRITLNSINTATITSAEAGRLILMRGDVKFTKALLIKNEVEVAQSSLLNSEKLIFLPGSKLIYSSDYNRKHNYNIAEQHPTSLVLDCNCEVYLGNEAAIANVTLVKGKIFLRDHDFTSTNITGSKQSYAVTDGGGNLIIDRIDTPVFFPIGTKESFSPIWISDAASSIIGARVKRPTEIECPEHAVWLLWELFSDGDGPIEVKVEWDTASQGKYFSTTEAVAEFDESIVSLNVSSLSTENSAAFAIEDVTPSRILLRNFNSPCSVVGTSLVDLYPNPAHRIVYIASSSGDLKVNQFVLFSLDGRQRFKSSTPARDGVYLPKEIVPGLYLVKVETNHGTVTKRLFIE